MGILHRTFDTTHSIGCLLEKDYVLFPENRETNCLSTKVEPITEMLSKISNSNAYIRLNLGSYSM